MSNDKKTEELYDIDSTIHFNELDKRILKLWKDLDVYNVLEKQTKHLPRFTHADGPPFMSGKYHMGHVLVSVIKDIICRWKVMQGYYVPRRIGADCHGVPVELMVNKECKLNSRADIEKFGIGNYNETCAKMVMKCAKEWEEMYWKLGRWVNFKDHYKTMDISFMESVWWVFKELFNKGYVDRGLKVVQYSTGCMTPFSNFEATLNYKDVTDQSVTIAFPLKGKSDTYFLAWTTTPWTLPSNLMLCTHPNMQLICVEDKNTKFKYILSEKLYENPKNQCLSKEFYQATKDSSKKTYLAKELAGTEYLPPFDTMYQLRNKMDNVNTAFKLCLDEYVTNEMGTGIVHQSPTHGSEDFRVCLREGVITKNGHGLLQPINDEGKFTADMKEFEGMYVKDKECEKKIIKYLADKKLLIHKASITHSYPFCWRTDTPLLYMAMPNWFVKVESMKDKLLKNSEKSNWIPDNIKTGRFNNWLEDAKDWCISRSRYWGTPIPIWVSDDGEVLCIGSVKELEELTKTKITDLHRHHIDHLVIKKNDKVFKRIPDVFDCWFESGSMPYGQLHYPFENKDLFQKTFPADFITESIDQTRGWFYTLLVIATGLFDNTPFKNNIVTGLINGADGKKMSKKSGNYTDPFDIMEKYGTDSFRLYIINSPVVRSQPLVFKVKLKPDSITQEESDKMLKFANGNKELHDKYMEELKEKKREEFELNEKKNEIKTLVKTTLLPWWNGFRFFLEYYYKFSKGVISLDIAQKSSHIMDQWILMKTDQFVSEITQELDKYHLYNITSKFTKFVDELTNWYIKLNRDRLKGNESLIDTTNSLITLFKVYYQICIVMSPVIPFITEEMYQILLKTELINPKTKKQSIHFIQKQHNIRLFEGKDKDNLVSKMEQFEKIVEMIRLVRGQHKINLITPLKKVIVCHSKPEFLDDIKYLELYLVNEVNLLNIEYQDIKPYVTYSLAPNLVELRKHLHKNNNMNKFKKITDEIKALESDDVKQYMQHRKFRLEDIELNDNLVEVQMFAVEIKDYAYHLLDSTLILVDLTQDEEVKESCYVRQFITEIQRMRKTSDLHPWDKIEVFYETMNDTLIHYLKNNHDKIESVIKYNVNLAKTSSDYNKQKIICSNETDIDTMKIKIVICQKL